MNKLNLQKCDIFHMSDQLTAVAKARHSFKQMNELKQCGAHNSIGFIYPNEMNRTFKAMN